MTGLLALIAAGAALWLGRRERQLTAALTRERERSEDLAHSIVFRTEGDRILDLSAMAVERCEAAPGDGLADVLGHFLRDGREETLAALDLLIRRGRPMRLLVTDGAGMPWELSGRPRGGELLVALTDASLVVTELRKSEARILARERALDAGWHERRTLSSLLEAGSIIAWQRAPDGGLLWAAGTVATREGAVTAQQITALVRARPDDSPPDEAGVMRSRLEILPPGAIEPLPLQVIEVLGVDGTISGVATDATVAAQAERTLGRFVQTMTETFAHLTAGLAIFDRNQKLVLFNPAFAQLLQLDPSWLANRPSLRDALDALRSNQRIPETGDFHAWRARLLNLFENPERADFDEVWHLADGTNMKVLARPHPHGSLAFVFDDISDRVRLEQRYRQSIDLQVATLNRLEEGLCVFGADGRLQLVNAAFHQIFGTDDSTVHPDLHAREVIRLCRGLTVETEVWERVNKFITAEGARGASSDRLTLGSNRALRLRLAPLPGGATMIVIVDVTDSERFADALRERNEALENAEEMRSAVLDQISHRLRTPLNTIFGFGQLLNDPRFGQLSGRQAEYAAGILEASGQLLDTIDEVTDLASLQPGRRPESESDENLDEIVSLAQSLLEKRAAEAGIILRFTPTDETLRAACDGATLRQIVFNMMAGAVQRAVAGSTVTVEVGGVGDDKLEIAMRERPRPAGQPNLLSTGEAAQTDGLAALSLTQRLVEAEGGSFGYGPAPQRPGDAATDMLTTVVFSAERERAGDLPALPKAVRS
ncbi:MAG: PAS-domain containing protein [Pseudomonadota bacterium]